MTADRRRYRLLLAYAVVLLPTIAVGAHLTLQSNNNSPLDWVSPHFAPRAEYDGFCQRFGPGDTVVLSWPGCTLDEARIDALSEALRNDPTFRDVQGRWLFYDVTSGREAVARMLQPVVDDYAAFERGEAIRQFQGTLIGSDAETTVVVITFTAAGLRQRERLVESIQQATTRLCGVDRDAQRLAGPVIDGLSVDRASQQTLDRFAVPSALVVFLLCWACLRSLKASAAVFGIALFCQGATLALLHYTGETMSALLVVLPAMIQVLAVAGGIHLTNYYFDSNDGSNAEDAARRALGLGWLPCVLSAGTTAIGMATLMSSGIAPIRSFGLYSSVGVVITTSLLLSILPAVYVFWPPRRPVTDERTSAATPRRRMSGWSILAADIGNYHGVIAVAGLAALMVGCWYVAKLKTSVRIETLFAKDSRILSDYAWIEANVGPLVPLEVVVTCHDDAGLTDYEKLAMLAALEEQLGSRASITGAFSAVQMIPPLPEKGMDGPEARREFVEQAAELLRPICEDVGYLVRRNGAEHWRLTLRCSALGDDDYGAMLDDVRTTAEQIIDGQRRRGIEGVDVHVTGIMPLVHEIQHALLRDLLVSFLGAFVLITVVMTVVEAGLLSGLVAMSANVLPVVAFFGVLGWRGAPVDIGTVMTASIALGIAVDDTLHFLTFFRRGLASGNDRRAAVRFALEHCGTAMMQTSVSCGLGMMVFAFSSFLPTSQFAWSMATLLALALAADLIFLPALLIGPLGRLFFADVRPATTTVGDDDVGRGSDSANGGSVASPHFDLAEPVTAGRHR
ncbi:MAG: MMPL family transporter [Planctomycetales bacterium]|nr:MMPL family transporter [Planctomycetales bacterium]